MIDFTCFIELINFHFLNKFIKRCEDIESISLADKENIDVNELPIRGRSIDRVISPSEDAARIETLMPCGTCGRSFNQKALERHANICKNVSSKLPRKVYDVSNIRTKDLEPVPRSMYTPTMRKKSSNKPEDDFQACPYCNRKFGPKVTFCFLKNFHPKSIPRN